MPDSAVTVAELKDALRRFVAERQWESYHSPKNLVMGLAIETAELMEHFHWLDGAESARLCGDPARRPAIAEEIADVACYLLALANVMGLELAETIFAKLEKNRRKYPAERFQGRYERPAKPPADRPLGPPPADLEASGGGR